MPVGTAISSVVIIIGTRSHDAMPLTNMWCAQTEKPSTTIAMQRERHQPVAEDRLPAEHGYDLADDPEAGQHHDVDGRVRVEPEDVLVPEHVAAVVRVEEVGVHHAVEHREELRAGDERRRDHDEQRRREVRPDEQRHAPEGHPRRAHRDDRDQEVERGHDRRRAGPLDAHVEEHLRRAAGASSRAARSPSSRTRRRRRGRRTTQSIMIPAIGSSQNESAFRRGNAMSGAPSISGTTKFARPANAGIDEEEDHQRRVDGDEPVERLRVEELHARLRELGADEHREDAADDEEEDRRDEVLDADHLVVGVDAEVVAPRLARRGRSGLPRASGKPSA